MHLVKSLFFGLVLLLCGHELWSDQYSPYQENGKYGLRNDTSGEVVIQPVYESIGWSDGSFKVSNNVIGAKQNEKWALINVEGNKITAHVFTQLTPFSGSLFIAGKRSQFSILVEYGLVNIKGKSVMPFEFSRLTPVEDQLIAVKRTANLYQSGVLNKNGKVIIDLQFPAVDLIEPGYYAVQDKDGLRAIYNSSGQALTEFEFESISPYSEELFLIKFYNRHGLINKRGKLVIPPIYKNIQLSGDKARALPFTKWYFYKSDQFERTFYFDDMNPVAPGMFSIASSENIGLIDENETYLSYKTQLELLKAPHGISIVRNPDTGYMGAFDSNGKMILPITFDSLKVFPEVIFGQIKKTDGQNWAAYNRKGEKLSLFDYETFNPLNNGDILASRNNKLGILNYEGNESSPFLYDSISSFRNELAVVKYQGQQGVISRDGIWVVTPYNDSITVLDDHIFLKKGSESKILDLEGNTLVSSYRKIFPLPQGYYEHTPEGSILYNLKQERLLDPVYDSLGIVHKDLYWLERNNRFFFYRPSDQADFALYEGTKAIGRFSEGFVSILIDNQWGYVNEEGQLAIANRYQAVDEFSEGISAVKLIGKWGFINRNEDLIIQPQYDEANAFYGGLAIVRKGNYYGMINRKGQPILGEQYDSIDRHEDYIFLKAGGLFGLADSSGKLVRPPQYDQILALDNGYFQVSKGSLKGVINLKGQDVVPLAYEKIRQMGDQFIASEKSDWLLLDIK